MNRFSKVIIFLLSSVLVIAYTNCSNEFQISQIDNFEESEHSVQDTSDDYIEPISPVVVDLPPAKPVSPSYKDVFIENPDWSFTDNFEGTKDTSFWNGGTKTSHSVSCQSSPDWDSKVLQFNYVNWESYKREWSEQRFRFPFNAVEIEVRYKLFVPANYVHQKNRNYKNIMFWSGKYGTSAANVSISSESWGDDGGGEASVYVGVDGTNNGHSMLRTDEKYMHKNQGRWQEVAFYLKLSSKDGEYGVFRIFRDGNYLTGTDHDDILGSNPEKLIKYSHRGNFIDRGYLLGWVNGGYSEDTYFCIDDFSIRLKK